MITILSGDNEWDWDDKNDNELEPSGIYTKNEFKKLLNDFRDDTPKDFIEIFKICVQFDRYNRHFFSWVSCDFNFLN